MNLMRVFQEESELPLPWWRKFYEWITLFISPDQLGYMVMIVVASIVRAMGVTIKSGETALLFTFGHAKHELQPGFRLLFPFLQVVKRMPSRSRTLDLPAQRVVTSDGLVYLVDANLVYRVVDIRKAVIEIDSLRKGMLQTLGLSVQALLRGTTRAEMSAPEELRNSLTLMLEERLAPWGVQVEQAGFTSITPSPRTLRVTQFAQNTTERVRALKALEASNIQQASALGLVGTRKRFERRTRARVTLATRRNSGRRIRIALLRRGISGARFGSLLKLARRSPTERHSSFKKDKATESKPALASR